MMCVLTVGILLTMGMFVSPVPVNFWCPYKCRCPSYHVANCSNARLQELPSGEFNVRVTDLDLSYNQLSSILEDHILNLRIAALDRANFSHNQIDNFDVHALHREIHLKVLDLSFNRLSRIHPRAFSIHTFQLEWLSLSMNPSLYLMKSGSSFISHSLLFLDLSHCNISSIPNNTFKHLPKLQTLILSHNSLKSLQKESFLGLESLNTLDLSHNRLQCLEINITDTMPKLSKLKLDDNSLLSPKALLRMLKSVEGRNKRSANLVSELYDKQCICNLTEFYINQQTNGTLTVEMGKDSESSNEEWNTFSGYNCESLMLTTPTRNGNASSMAFANVPVNLIGTSSPFTVTKEVTLETAGTSAGWITALTLIWCMNVVVAIVLYKTRDRNGLWIAVKTWNNPRRNNSHSESLSSKRPLTTEVV